jgi:hypothetical protein
MFKSENSPVVIHVKVEVVQIVKDDAALDAVDGPEVILDLMLVFAHLGIVVAAAAAAAVAAAVHAVVVVVVVSHGHAVAGGGGAHLVHRRRDGRLESKRRLSEMFQGELGDSSAATLVVVNTWN